MNTIDEFDDDITGTLRPSSTTIQYFQAPSKVASNNFHYNNSSNFYGNNNFNYYGNPRQVVHHQNLLGSPLIRQPCYPSRQLYNSTSHCYRITGPAQQSNLPNYYSRGADYRPRSSQPVLLGNPSNGLRQSCHVYPNPSNQYFNQSNHHSGFTNLPSTYKNNNNPIQNVQQESQQTRILSKPITNLVSRSDSLSSLNPATVTICIPVADMKDRPASVMDIVHNISKRTNTHIFAYDGCGVQENSTITTQVKYCIYGKWRDCFEAGKLLYKKLTKIYTAYIHESWLSFIDQKVPKTNLTLRNLYPVTIKHVPSVKVLAISGYYWDVLKMRKELVLRQRKKVTRMSGDMLIVDFATDSVMEENESIVILSRMKSDIDSALNMQGALVQNQPFSNVSVGHGQHNVLKATEFVRLMVGPDMPTSSQEVAAETQCEDFEPLNEICDNLSTDDDIDVIDESIKSNEKTKPPSIVFVPGDDISIFSSELFEEDEEMYQDVFKLSTVGHKVNDFEVAERVLTEDSNQREFGQDDEEAFDSIPPDEPNAIFEQYDTTNNEVYGVEIPILDDVDKLEEIDFPEDI